MTSWRGYKHALDRVLAYAKVRGLKVLGRAEYLLLVDAGNVVVFSGSARQAAAQILERP